MTNVSWQEDQLRPSYNLPVPSHWGTRGNTESLWLGLHSHLPWSCLRLLLASRTKLLNTRHGLYGLTLFGFSLLISWKVSLLHSSYWLAVRSFSSSKYSVFSWLMLFLQDQHPLVSVARHTFYLHLLSFPCTFLLQVISWWELVFFSLFLIEVKLK